MLSTNPRGRSAPATEPVPQISRKEQSKADAPSRLGPANRQQRVFRLGLRLGSRRESSASKWARMSH
jgi:hypothetical protein